MSETLEDVLAIVAYVTILVVAFMVGYGWLGPILEEIL